MLFGLTRGQEVEIRSIVRDVMETAQSMKEPIEQDVIYLSIAGVLAGLGDLEKAYDTANLISKAHYRSFARLGLFEFQVKAGGIPEIEDILLHIEVEELKTPALVALMKVQIDKGYSESALRTYAKIIDPWYRKMIWSNLVGDDPQYVDIKAVQHLAEQLTVQEDRDWAMTGIATAFAQSGDLQGATQLIAQIINQDAKETALWGVAGAQGKAGNIQSALKTIAHLKIRRQVSAAALAEIAASQTKVRDYEEAVKTASRLLDKNDWGCVIGRVAVMQAYNGNLYAALQTSSLIETSPEKFQALQGIIRVQLENGDVQGALKTANSVGEPAGRKILVSRLALAQAEMGDLDNAFTTLAKLKGTRGYEDMMIPLLGMQAQQGAAREALATVETFKSTFSKAMAKIEIADGVLAKDKTITWFMTPRCGHRVNKLNIFYK